MVTTVTDATFKGFTTGGYTVIDFFAPWCSPCRMLAPLFDQAAAEQRQGLRFGRCDVDQNPLTATRLGIMSIPTLVLFDASGAEVNRLIGTPGRRAFQEFLDGVAPGTA
jgi:thioredoxin 1